MSTGVAVLHQPDVEVFPEGKEDTTDLQFPAAEGSLTMQLMPRYDLALTTMPWKATAEGNALVVDNGSLRLGIIHGLGMGFIADITKDGGEEERDWVLLYDMSIGLMLEAETSESSSLFTSAKYSYSDYTHGGAETDDPDTSMPTNTIAGSIGYLAQLGALQIIPEIIVSRASYEDQSVTYSGSSDGNVSTAVETTDRTYWLFLVGLTVAAPF
jgi:hypothetical protein